jgi:hypothetical protein
MAITFMDFELPEAIHPVSNAEINHFLSDRRNIVLILVRCRLGIIHRFNPNFIRQKLL